MQIRIAAFAPAFVGRRSLGLCMVNTPSAAVAMVQRPWLKGNRVLCTRVPPRRVMYGITLGGHGGRLLRAGVPYLHV